MLRLCWGYGRDAKLVAESCCGVSMVSVQASLGEGEIKTHLHWLFNEREMVGVQGVSKTHSETAASSSARLTDVTPVRVVARNCLPAQVRELSVDRVFHDCEVIR